MNFEHIKQCVSSQCRIPGARLLAHSCSNYLYPIKQAWRLSSGQVQQGLFQVSQAMLKHSVHESTDRDRLEAGFAMGQDVDTHGGTSPVQRLLLL